MTKCDYCGRPKVFRADAPCCALAWMAAKEHARAVGKTKAEMEARASAGRRAEALAQLRADAVAEGAKWAR